MPKHTCTAHGRRASKGLLREYFVRCSHGTAAAHASAAAAGALLLVGPQTNGLDQRPVLQHVQIGVQREVHGDQQIGQFVEPREFGLVRD